MSALKKNGCSYFWMNPSFLYLGLLAIPVYAFMMDAESYRLLYGVPTKDINLWHIFLYSISAILFYFGAKTAKRISVEVELNQCESFEKAYSFLFVLTIFAYTVWYGRFILFHGVSSFLLFYDSNFVSQHMYTFRRISGRIGGLTTMTELGVVVAPLAVLFYHMTAKKKYLSHVIILVCLSIIRSALFSERLAFLEIAIPGLCVYLSIKRYKRFLEFVPLIGLFLVLVIFGAAEYGRSWLRYYSNFYSGSYVTFVLDRVLGYYTIAVNTECSMMEHSNNVFFPFLTAGWIFDFPFMSDLLGQIGIKSDFETVLKTYGSVEFNNPGGLLSGVTDFGYVGILLSFCLGRIYGGFYKSFKANSLIGIIFYPIFLFTLLELPRYFFFGSNRGFYVMLAMIFIYYKLKKSKHFSVYGAGCV